MGPRTPTLGRWRLSRHPRYWLIQTPPAALLGAISGGVARSSPVGRWTHQQSGAQPHRSGSNRLHEGHAATGLGKRSAEGGGIPLHPLHRLTSGMAARSSGRSIETCCLVLRVSSGKVNIRDTPLVSPAPAPVARLRSGAKCAPAKMVSLEAAPASFAAPDPAQGGFSCGCRPTRPSSNTAVIQHRRCRRRLASKSRTGGGATGGWRAGIDNKRGAKRRGKCSQPRERLGRATP